MRKKSNQQPLKDAIMQYLKAFNLEGRLKEVDVIQGWEQMMGPTIAKYTGDIYIREGVLFVHLRSAALRQELSLARATILNNINEAAGQPVIHDIVFR